MTLKPNDEQNTSQKPTAVTKPNRPDTGFCSGKNDEGFKNGNSDHPVRYMHC